MYRLAAAFAGAMLGPLCFLSLTGLGFSYASSLFAAFLIIFGVLPSILKLRKSFPRPDMSI